MTDGWGVIREANHAAADLLRCPNEFLIGKPLALFGALSARPRFYAAPARFRRGAALEAFETYPARRADPPREVHVFGWASADAGTRHWLARDVTEQERAESAHAELRQRLAPAQEDERRVSRDLHDTVGRTLTALAVRAVRDAAPLPEPARNRLEHVQRLADELARQVHDLATRLRPTAPDDLGLEAAARQLVTDWSARTGVAIDFRAVGLSARLPADVETALYRVVQEALTNAPRHARARHVAIVLERSSGGAVAVIEDDGIGFDTEADVPTPPAGRLGLLGMCERVGSAGGTLAVESVLGQGTTVIARIPLPSVSIVRC